LISERLGYTVPMTTFTIDTPVKLPRSHFHDVHEASRFLAQWCFETELEESVGKAEKMSRDEFISI